MIINRCKKKRLTLKELGEVFCLDAKTIGYRLNHGMDLKEALVTPLFNDLYDLTGHRFSRLLVQYRIPVNNSNGSKYHCLCDCGKECDVLAGNLRSGKQKSCGCLNIENHYNRHKNLSGQIINNIKIIRRAEDEIDSKGHHYIRYLCECPHCGNEFVSRISNIKSGNTGSCGCTRNQYTHHIDLVGRDFEFCHVNKRLPNQIQPSGGSKVMYECTCCCGTIYADWAFTILHGRSNCGCKRIMSKGEVLTKEWLTKHNINFTTQYWFDDLRGKRKMPYFFDFGILDDEENLICLIEYQGEQHYHEVKYSMKDFGKQQREVTDLAKKEYCKRNNIKLFEIAYFENVDSRCEEIFNLLYHDNTVPSSQETA